MADFVIHGVDEVVATLDKLPMKAKKCSDAAMRAGGRAAANLIRMKGPSEFAHLVKFRLHTDALKNSYVMVGYQNPTGKKRQVRPSKDNKEIPDWFKAYWKNYGTLTHRDPSHHFKRKIRPRVPSRRNNTGQPAENFFGPASAGSDKAFLEAYRAAFKKQFDAEI